GSRPVYGRWQRVGVPSWPQHAVPAGSFFYFRLRRLEDLHLHGLSPERPLELPDPGFSLPEQPGWDHVLASGYGRVRPLLEEPLPLAHDGGADVQLTRKPRKRNLAPEDAVDLLLLEGGREQPAPIGAPAKFPHSPPPRRGSTYPLPGVHSNWGTAYLVERNFSAERPNPLWVSDLTYVATWRGFVYV